MPLTTHHSLLTTHYSPLHGIRDRRQGLPPSLASADKSTAVGGL